MAFGLRAVIAGLMVASALAAPPVRAAAVPGTVAAGVEPQGYARIVFSFQDLPGASARLANSVLIVSFADRVELDIGPLTRGLGSLVGMVRRDPDGAAIRISLTRPVKLVATEAGEKLFVDLLPPNWDGLPPPLPREVIAELTREAREGREIRAEEARRRVKPQPRLTLEGATHPTFRRLIFGLGGEAPVDVERVGEKVRVTIDAPYSFDLAAARARLPPELAGIEAEQGENGLTLTIPAPGGGAFRTFREDGDFLLDLDRADIGAASHEADAPAPRAEPARAAAPAQSRDAGHGVPAAIPVAVAVAAPVAPAPKHAATHEPAVARAPAETAPQPAAPHAAPPAKTAAPPTAQAATPHAGADLRTVAVRKVGGTVRLAFPFARAAPAAVFLRGRTLWAAFDDPGAWTLDGLVRDSGGVLTGAEETPVERGRVIRLKLAEPRLVSAAAEGADWVVSIGEEVLQRSAPLEFAASFGEDGRARAAADLPGLGEIRVLRDPEVGDRLALAALGQSARNIQKPQSFVEFSTLPTAQGVAIALAADDLRIRADVERLVVEREAGLTLTAAGQPASDAEPEPSGPASAGQARDWAEETSRPFRARENELMRAAALASAEDRPAARLALARFYHARGRAGEAKAVLDAIVEDGGISERDERLALLRAGVAVELGRPRAALAILASPAMRMTPEIQLWRAAAEAATGNLGSARTALRQGEVAMSSLPAELRARFAALAVDLALDAGDAAAASAAFERLEVLPATRGFAARELARARVAEALGHTKRAAAVYASLSKSQTEAASAEAELRGVELALRTGGMSLPDAIVRLERLTTGWRGDDVEAAALARLIGLYGDAGRWREAFSTLRTAVAAFPDSEDTRALQDRMQSRFTDLFLGAGVDSLPKLDALALFYDFKELSPGGKRGDELVRRLADKLVDVDLLDQAAELLDYQIDNRLSGAARAQVAARAALVDLMNAKPAKALETLRKTRQADLPGSLVSARLRLEARALAETGKVDLALEMAAGLQGAEADRLKADILWTARRWPEAGEALEATLGSAWRRPDALTAEQRADVMRAAIALSLADDGLGVDRLRQKFTPKMADSPEAAGFDVVTAPIEARGDAFREIARSVASRSSFETFLREYRRRAEDQKPAEPRPAPRPDTTAAGATPSRV